MDTGVNLPAPVAAKGGVDELSKWLGRREAFGLVAGRCSAADVECMRRIRDEKLFLQYAPDWGEFCEKYLHMSKSSANHQIQFSEEFGPEYHNLAQLTRISVADYRTIASAVSPKGIEFNGEVIPLNAENGERLAAAVASLKGARGAKSEPGFQERLATLKAAGDRLLKKFQALSEDLLQMLNSQHILRPLISPAGPKPAASAHLVSMLRLGGLHHRYSWREAA